MNTPPPTYDYPPTNLHENDTILKFIREMLMEEEDELENESLTLPLHDSLALQATEKSLYDALTNNNNNVDHLYQNNDDDQFLHHNQNNTTKYRNREEDEEEEDQRSNKQSASSNNNNVDLHQNNDDDQFLQHNPNNTTKNRNQEEEEEHQRSNKQSANNNVSESEPLEIMYDDFLLRFELSKNKSRGKKEDVITKEFFDLRSLLFQCAQAVSDFDSAAVHNLITRIRQHSSPHGDEAQRVAHYFANALEARFSGNSSAQHSPYKYVYRRVPLFEILKGYKMLITACPFTTMSNLFVKQTLLKLMMANNNGRATTLHIIDFGVAFGFQWPCLILALSERPGGPPKLRMTGIDFPLPGFRPAEKVSDTGRRLVRYCKIFGVPFEYNAIAQKWDTIRPEDIKVEKGEVLVVNCMYQLHNLTDEAETLDCPRDAFLKLMKKMNPDMFVHGIVNATHNTPYFISRCRQAYFYYLAIFDMFEATVAREDEDQRMRVGFEEHLWGKGVMNIVACEGVDRTERPVSYRQWEFRTRRAGFRQVSIDGEIVKCVGKVKKDYNYHKDYSVDKDGEWMVLGWKGRVINAISRWQPANLLTTAHLYFF